VAIVLLFIYVGGDEDYNSGPHYVTLTPEATRFPFNVSIIDDSKLEKDENFLVAIDLTSLPCGIIVDGPGQATVTILNDDGKWILMNS